MINSSDQNPENTILLVDDEENIIRALKRLLRRDGYNILTAKGGKAGLEVLKDHEVGVILSDQRMPEMSGVEFLSQVKEIYPETVRMVLSGYTDLKSVTDAINHGAIYKFLTKPWEDDLLRENIVDAFNHFNMSRENERLNQQLKSLNKDLEDRVAQKTRESIIKLKMLQFTQDVMDTQPVGVLGISDDNMIALANNRTHELLDVPSGSLLSGDATQLLPEEIRSCYSALEYDEDEVNTSITLSDTDFHVIAKKMEGSSGARGIIVTIIQQGT